MAKRKTTKDQLMEKAVHLFSKQGYGRTTFKDIAKAVGVQGQALYYYFTSKKDLLQQVHEESWQRFEGNVLNEMRKGDDPEERIKIYIRNMIKYQFTLGEKIYIMDDPTIVRFIKERRTRDKQFVYFMRDTIRKFLEVNRLERSIDPTVAAFTLFNMVGHIHKWYNPKGRISIDELTDQITEFFFYGLCKGKCTEGEV